MRKIFSLECEVKNTTVNGKPQTAKDVLHWLEEAAESAYPIKLRSTYYQIDDHEVIIAPPNIYPIKANPETDMISFSCMVM
jgi:hypothetical protein